MKTAMSAQKLRALLIAVMLLLFVGATAGFIFAQQQLQNFATTIVQLEADAQATNGNIASLQQLEKTLTDYASVQQKANSIAINASDYPVEVINTLTQLANQSGIRLTNVSYGNNENAGSGGAPSGSPAPTPASPAPGGANATPSTPAGLTKRMLNVTVQSPVDYNGFTNFLSRVENSSMHLHITKLSLARESGNSISVQPFTVEVYLR